MQRFWQWFGPRTAALLTAVAILAAAPAIAEAAPRGGGHGGGGRAFSGGGMGGGGFKGGNFRGGNFRAAPGPRISGGAARSYGSIGRGPRMRGPGHVSRGIGRPGHHVKPGGPRHHYGHKHRRRPYVIYGSPFLYDYYYDYYDAPAVAYGTDCDWLYRKATSTGKSYWWRRYEQCMDY